jgi:hypothetical protein
MKSSNHWPGRIMAILFIVLLACPAGHSGSVAAQQAVPNGPQAASSSLGSANASGNQQSNDANSAESALPENPAPANSPPVDQGQQPPTTQPDPAQSQDNSHRPVGTAAAPYEPTTGIAASRPAGAAIAPAKQRRVRTFLISLGVIAGAGIAVGSVVALSHGSPGRP